jgi:transposase
MIRGEHIYRWGVLSWDGRLKSQGAGQLAGLSSVDWCVFRLREGSIMKEQLVEFLKALRAHFKQPLLIIWDGLKAHRSKLVRECLASIGEDIPVAFLPPYSPDLNPVEYLWTWL